MWLITLFFFFFQAEDGIRDLYVTGVQTCALPISVLAQRVQGHLGAGVEARLEVTDVDRLRVRAERLERHRLLLVRAAQLAHAHVDGHLPALERGPPLGARARARALLPAA